METNVHGYTSKEMEEITIWKNSFEKPKIMSKVYFFHTTKLDLVKTFKLPGATIALKRVDDTFHYGISICSKYDNFSKKYGREIAQSRLERGFGIIQVPKVVKDFPEQEGSLKQLYQLATTVATRTKKWKKRIAKFNKAEQTVGRLVNMSDYSDHSSNQTSSRA